MAITLLVVVFIGYRTIRPKTGTAIGTIQRGEVKQTLTLSGEIASDEDATLQFNQAGKLAWVAVKDGQWVNSGTGLMGLDAIVLNSAYETALNTYRSTQATVDKIHDDVKDHSTDETLAQRQTRTIAEVANDNAYEAVKIAKKNLDESTLVSPVSGYVTLLGSAVAGVNVMPGVPQVEVVNPASIYLLVTADQTDVVNLKTDALAQITLDAYPETTLSGKVVSIGMSPKAGETGTVYAVKLTLTAASQETNYKIGMTGDADFVIADKQGVLYIDSQFIKTDAGEKYLLVGQAKKKVYVETGVEGDSGVEIVGGNVQVGEIVS